MKKVDVKEGHFIKVSVLAGRSLKAMDTGNTSDPYVIVSLFTSEKEREEIFRTPVVKKSLNPVWVGAKARRKIQHGEEQVWSFQVLDKDLIGSDFLGTATLSSNLVTMFCPTPNVTQVSWLILQGKADDVAMTNLPYGELCVTMTLVDRDPVKLLEAATLLLEHGNTGGVQALQGMIV